MRRKDRIQHYGLKGRHTQAASPACPPVPFSCRRQQRGLFPELDTFPAPTCFIPIPLAGPHGDAQGYGDRTRIDSADQLMYPSRRHSLQATANDVYKSPLSGQYTAPTGRWRLSQNL
jgi:hypothetical protein